MPKKQPTILVKKADGTKVRVSLAEFRKMRASGGSEQKEEKKVEATPVQANVEPPKPVVPVVEEKKKEPIKEIPKATKPVVKKETSKPVPPQPIKKEVVPPPQPVKKIVGDKAELDKIIAAEESRTQLSKQSLEKVTEKVPTEEKSDDIQVATPHELATTTPVTDIFVDEAQAAVEWDHSSLLEEDMSEIEELKKQGAVHTTHEDVAQKVKLPKTSKKDDNVSTRLKSLIASWQKGIRSDVQFIDLATREVVQGGVGMDKASAQGLLDELQATKKAGTGFATNETQQKKRVTMDDIRARDHVPQVQSPVMKTNRVTPPRPTPPREHIAPANVMRDVHTPMQKDRSSKTVGPQQEAGTFTLVDFRRLSREPAKAGEMLAAKFMHWREESFLLYMNARESWHQSPLYQQYIALTQEAMDSGMPIAEVIASKNPEESMTFEEYQHIIQVDNQLTV